MDYKNVLPDVVRRRRKWSIVLLWCGDEPTRDQRCQPDVQADEHLTLTYASTDGVPVSSL
jgi:hypothetical protein